MKTDDQIIGNLMSDLSRALEKVIVGKAEHYIPYPDGRSQKDGINDLFLQAYKNVDLEKVKREITERLEFIMAEKIVASIATEYGNDIKQMMSNAVIRKDLQDWLQVQTADLLKKIS